MTEIIRCALQGQHRAWQLTATDSNRHIPVPGCQPEKSHNYVFLYTDWLATRSDTMLRDRHTYSRNKTILLLIAKIFC